MLDRSQAASVPVIENGQDAAQPQQPSPLPAWRDAICAAAAHFRLDVSRERMRVEAAWDDGQDRDDSVRRLAAQAGLTLRFVEPNLRGLDVWRLPVVLELRDGKLRSSPVLPPRDCA